MRSFSVLAVAGATTALMACGALRPPEELDRDARAFLRLVAQNHLDSALALAQFDGPPDTIRNRLAQGRDFISTYAVDSAELIGWNVTSMGETRGALTYEIRGEARWALLLVTIVDRGATSRVTGFRWEPIAARLADLNAFTLTGRSLVHYVYLILALAAVLVCLLGAVVAGVRRMGLRWVLFSLVGVGSATINWTTGQQAFNPVSVRLLAAGYKRPGMVGPWHVSWSLPLGAILVLIRQRRRRSASAEPPVAA